MTTKVGQVQRNYTHGRLGVGVGGGTDGWQSVSYQHNQLIIKQSQLTQLNKGIVQTRKKSKWDDTTNEHFFQATPKTLFGWVRACRTQTQVLVNPAGSPVHNPDMYRCRSLTAAVRRPLPHMGQPNTCNLAASNACCFSSASFLFFSSCIHRDKHSNVHSLEIICLMNGENWLAYYHWPAWHIPGLCDPVPALHDISMACMTVSPTWMTLPPDLHGITPWPAWHYPDLHDIAPDLHGITTDLHDTTLTCMTFCLTCMALPQNCMTLSQTWSMQLLMCSTLRWEFKWDRSFWHSWQKTYSAGKAASSAEVSVCWFSLHSASVMAVSSSSVPIRETAPFKSK